ncbi:MAG: M23 family metallopeptidase [Gordonia sp. (in: high G+C Gram-positive bacteria)]
MRNLLATSGIRGTTGLFVGLAVLLVSAPAGAAGADPPASVASPPARSGYAPPLAGRPLVVRGFDNPAQRWQPGHRGVDLTAAPGTAVRAAGDGVVRFVGVVAGTATVSISHDDGIITTYEPVRGSVHRADRVRRGTIIGTVDAGHAGCPASGGRGGPGAPSACLHWGARRGAGHDARYLDPLALLGAVRVRLKPV